MRSFRKAHPAAGARPGTLVIPAGSPRPQLFLVQYSATTLEERQLASPAEIPAECPAGLVTWIDVHGYGDEQVIRAIGQRFGMTALELEDAVNAPQRPKCEGYADHLLVISRVPLARGEVELSQPQVCLLVGAHYVVTFQEQPFGLFQPVRERIRQGVGRPLRRSGPDYLAYALIDTMVDRYYPVAESISDELDDIEDALVEESETEILGRLRRVRVSRARRRVQPAPQEQRHGAREEEAVDHVEDAALQHVPDNLRIGARSDDELSAGIDRPVCLLRGEHGAGANEEIRISGSALRSGRWYVVPSNVGSTTSIASPHCCCSGPPAPLRMRPT